MRVRCRLVGPAGALEGHAGTRVNLCVCAAWLQVLTPAATRHIHVHDGKRGAGIHLNPGDGRHLSRKNSRPSERALTEASALAEGEDVRLTLEAKVAMVEQHATPGRRSAHRRAECCRVRPIAGRNRSRPRCLRPPRTCIHLARSRRILRRAAVDIMPSMFARAGRSKIQTKEGVW